MLLYQLLIFTYFFRTKIYLYQNKKNTNISIKWITVCVKFKIHKLWVIIMWKFYLYKKLVNIKLILFLRYITGDLVFNTLTLMSLSPHTFTLCLSWGNFEEKDMKKKEVWENSLKKKRREERKYVVGSHGKKKIKSPLTCQKFKREMKK